jgi:hypothetical protein
MDALARHRVHRAVLLVCLGPLVVDGWAVRVAGHLDARAIYRAAGHDFQTARALDFLLAGPMSSVEPAPPDALTQQLQAALA